MTTAPDGGPAKTAPAAMLTDAIGRIAVLEHHSTSVRADLSESMAIQKDIAETTLPALRQDIERLALAVDLLANPAEQEAEDDDGTALVDWSSLDRAAAGREWDRLYQWLDTWLVPTYEIQVRQLMPCWTYHPRVREELSWLRVCWTQAYKRPSASGSAAGEWHTRWLPAALQNIREHFKLTLCSQAHHRDRPVVPEEIRAKFKSDDLSVMQSWMDQGRIADIERRH